MSIAARPMYPGTYRAAQYIRMSTDRQDLSPGVQRDAIASYAAARGYSIVATYEDSGRSGVQIGNRPALRQLIRDVVDGTEFDTVFVYDVSRWGRFQDADASAYYEYHCRLHGVNVVYIAESFGNDTTSMSTLLKNMKRVMAAEYSRDLAIKSRAGQGRVVSMGFHMGSLPPLGYRRCSVSSDGRRRVLLAQGQQKLALTDRIEWVLAPNAEVELVRRICRAFAYTELDLWQIASLVRAEGWQTIRGKQVTNVHLLSLVRDEALIGNFVWGISGQNAKRRIVASEPTRHDGSVPRIIDDETWSLMQDRLAGGSAPRDADLADRKQPFVQEADFPWPAPRPTQLVASKERVKIRARQAIEFGEALAEALCTRGLSCAFDRKLHVLSIRGAKFRVRLLWREDGEWIVSRLRARSEAVHFVMARMETSFRPLDFFAIPKGAYEMPRTVAIKFSEAEFRQFRCSTPEELSARLKMIASSRSQAEDRTAPNTHSPAQRNHTFI